MVLRANLSGYESRSSTDVTTFERRPPVSTGWSNLIYAVDPSAFYLQTTEGVMGTVSETVSGVSGAYLVPDDFLGYLATGLDYGLLTPTGLDYVLTPLIDLLAGSPVADSAVVIHLYGRCRPDRWGQGVFPHRFGCSNVGRGSGANQSPWSPLARRKNPVARSPLAAGRQLFVCNPLPSNGFQAR